jgi:hypothetical protein
LLGLTSAPLADDTVVTAQDAQDALQLLKASVEAAMQSYLSIYWHQGDSRDPTFIHHVNAWLGNDRELRIKTTTRLATDDTSEGVIVAKFADLSAVSVERDRWSTDILVKVFCSQNTQCITVEGGPKEFWIHLAETNFSVANLERADDARVAIEALIKFNGGKLTKLSYFPAQDKKTTSSWKHNGSLMTLDAWPDGMREFYYDKPRESLSAKFGIQKGTILFSGKRIGYAYSGIAYLFSKDCGTQPYELSGTVSTDERVVTLNGRKPTLDPLCRDVGFENPDMTFTLEGNESSGASAIAPIAADFRIQQNTDLLGTDYWNKKEISLQECEAFCKGQSKCQAYSYVESKKWCWLKSDVTSDVAKGGITAGLKHRHVEFQAPLAATTIPQASVSFRILKNTDLTGADYWDKKEISLQECEAFCKEQAKCHAYSYVESKKWCWLKSDVTAEVARAGITTGLKN